MASPDLEETTEFTPRFGEDGLLTAVVVDSDGAPLMLAHMNEAALEATLNTGEAHFWSRSRAELWHKGATSRNVLEIREIRTDCDQDALWIVAEPRGTGVACHTGRRSCFYRTVDAASRKLVFDEPST